MILIEFIKYFARYFAMKIALKGALYVQIIYKDETICNYLKPNSKFKQKILDQAETDLKEHRKRIKQHENV